MGCRTSRGSLFNKNSLRTVLRNEKYIGVYDAYGVHVEGGVPAIIDTALFQRVQNRIAVNRRNPARYKAHEKYVLSGKIYCGYCNAPIIGISGTSKSEQKRYYYACTGKIRTKNCTKKNIRKATLEKIVADGTVEFILNSPQRIDYIAHRCVELHSANPLPNTELVYLESQLADTKKALSNLLTAIENGIFTKTTKQRLSELEQTQENLEFEIESYKLRVPELTEKQVKYMLSQMTQRPDEPDDIYRERLLDCFVNSVHLYDDKVIVSFNLTNKKATLESVTLSLLKKATPAQKGAVCECSFLDLFGGDDGN